jgi:hypothetical protein
MLALRILIGVTSVLLMLGWAALLVVAGGLRSWYRSGAGRENVAGALLSVAVPALCLALLLTVVFPSRGLLHTVAVVVGLCCVGLVWVATQSPGTAFFALAYLAPWIVYYWLAAWSPAA